MQLTAGKVLQNGKYVLDTVIGQGGFGITYKATHSLLGQTVVIKTLQQNLRQQENYGYFEQQFIGEAQRLAKCQHPHIVRVLDFFQEDGQPFIVMDYIPGPTLAELVQPSQPLPEAQAIHYMHQIGAALSTVHQNGLLHRDVKPQNIIRREGTDSVILIDFGIAREFTLGVTQTQTGMLSAGYAPPEQYVLRQKRSPATDIYALAATLYCLVTGQPPVPAVLRDRYPLSTPRQLVPHLSAAIEQAILRGLEMDAQKRPQTVESWLNLLPDQNYTPEPTQRPETVTRHPFNLGYLSPKNALQVVGIAALFAAIVGLAFGLSVRINGNGLPFLQREQSFPPTENWPTAAPTIESESSPEPESTPETNSNTEPPAPEPTPSPRRRSRTFRSYQIQPTPSPEPETPRYSRPLPSRIITTPSPTPEAAPTPSEPTPTETNSTSAPTPEAALTPTAEPSPIPSPVTAEPAPTTESPANPPSEIEPLPKAPASEAPVAPNESPLNP